MKKDKNNNKYIKNIKAIFKNNIKIVIGFTIGLLIAGASVYAATIYFASSEVSYDDTKVSGTLGASTVQDALDELYDKAKNCGNYAKVNITNGTVSPSSKNVIGDSTTFDITPPTDYGCNNDIDTCELQCSNGATAIIPNNSTTLTVSNITRNTECTVGLTRVSNFSYTTTSTTTTSSPACCSSTMPSFSTAYGTFKINGTVYLKNKIPLEYYCIPVNYVENQSGSSCSYISTSVYKAISCQVASTDSANVCGGVGGTVVYNIQKYESNRTHSCGQLTYTTISDCPSW